MQMLLKHDLLQDRRKFKEIICFILVHNYNELHFIGTITSKSLNLLNYDMHADNSFKNYVDILRKYKNEAIVQ